MDLFVSNRHEDTINREQSKADEDAKLQKVLQRVEKNKNLRQERKEKIKLKQREDIQRTLEKRQLKREFKRTQPYIINTNDVNTEEFIDKNIQELDVESERSNKAKRKLDASEVEGFTILGNDNFKKVAKVKRILPKWLSNPVLISINLQNLQTKVSAMKVLDKNLRAKLKANGIKYFFPVQAQVIPWLLKANQYANVIFPRDICVSAPTGSGKTLAFVLPVIQALKSYTIKRTRALVILPTQDLAIQVFKTFKKYTQSTNLDVCLITGKNPFATEQRQLVTYNEAFGYLTKTDILVCTAGRLVDHLKATKGLNLQHLEFLIIDEADRVLEIVQDDWLYHLEKHIYQNDTYSSKVVNRFTLNEQRPPQKLLFSATLSQDPEKLEKLSLFQPKLFTSDVEDSDQVQTNMMETSDTFVGKYTTPTELTEKYIVCSMDVKPLVLYEFIHSENLTKTLVFTHSADSAHRLTILLKLMFKDQRKIEEISSNFNTKQRNDVIDGFSNGNVDVIICTDRLARGIDLTGVQCVISYSVPKYLKSYIHRAGRTARAGEPGLAVTLLQKTQLNKFLNLLQHAEKNNLQEITISEEALKPLEKLYKKSLNKLKTTVVNEDKKDIKKIKFSKRSGPFKRKRNVIAE